MPDYTDNKPFTHDELTNLSLDVMENSVIVAMQLDEMSLPATPAYVMAQSADISEKLHNLILAAPQLYRSLNGEARHLLELQNIIEALQADYTKRVGQPLPTLTFVIERLEALQNALMISCRCATEGIGKVADELRKTY